MTFARTLSVITALIAIALPRAYPQVQRQWLQSSSADFMPGAFRNTIVTNTFGGDVRLQEPLYKSRADSITPFPGDRNISLDSAGRFIRAWQDHDSIVVRRFDAGGNPLSPPIRVDDPGNGLVYNERYPLALMDNGYYYVGWISPDSGMARGQLFGPGDVKIGANRQLAEAAAMDVFANNADTSFWIITVNRNGTETDTSSILALRVDLAGELVEPEPKRLHERIKPEGILDAVAQMSRSGDFLLGWIASGGIVGGVQETLFVQRFDGRGVPRRQPGIVNDVRGRGISWPRLAVDDSGRYLAVWADNRNGPPGSHDFDVYAQLYESDDAPVRANFMVNAPLGPAKTEERWTDVHFRDGRYTIFWSSWNPAAFWYDPYSSEWSYSFERSGEYVSRVFDTGPLLNGYDTLSSTTALPAGTSLSFRLRSANSFAAIDTAAWRGPGFSPDSVYPAAGGRIDPGHGSDRFVQYAAYLGTSQWGVTPILRDVRLTYRIDSVPPPAPPASATLVPGHGRISITWQDSPSPAILAYRIFRGTASGSYDPGWTRTVPEASNGLVDTAITIGATYYYAVTAIDSNLQESDYSNEVAGRSEIVTFYVSSESPDDGEGTFESPFNTIQEATARALDDDTVIVLPGDYSGMVRIPPRVALIGSGAPYTTISAGGDSSVVRCGHRSILRGFTIRLTGAATGWSAVWCGNSGATIEDNIIVNMVPENNPNDYQGIFANGGLPLIRRNYVVDFESGIDISDEAIAVVANNVVISRLVGIQLFNHASATIVNNTVSIIRQHGSGILALPNPAATVRNNVITGFSAATGTAFNTSCYLALVEITAEYNDVWNFSEGYECVHAGPGNLQADPLFVNPGTGDYRLRPDSPCRNAGDPAASFNDADGSRNDLGAFGGPDPIDAGMFAGFDVFLGVGSTSGFPGDTVVVEVSIENGARLTSADWTVYFDRSLVALLSAQATEHTDSMLLTVDTAVAGAIHVSLSGAPLDAVGVADLLRLEFTVDPAAAAERASPLELAGISLRDGDGAEIDVRGLVHGAIVVSPGGDGGRYVFVDRRNASAIEDGTRSHPWKTIGGGVAHSAPGDTILVAAGTYEEVVSMPDSIHLRGSGAAITTLRPDSASSEYLQPAIRFLSSHGSSVSRMTLADAVWDLAPASGPVEAQSSSFEISHCLITTYRPPLTPLVFVWRNSHASIHDNALSGGVGPSGLIEIYDTSSAEIHRNSFGPADRGVAILQSRAKIGNNRFDIAGGGEAQITINSEFPVTVHNNLLESANNDGILIVRGDSTSILNNTVAGGFRGIETRDASPRVANNIVTGNVHGIVLGGGPPSMFNDSWGNGTDYVNGTPGEGDISADPLFADTAGRDFHLSAGSPCRDAGDPDPLFNDLDGTRNDIGVYGGPLLDTTFFTGRGATLRIGGVIEPTGDTIGIPITGAFLKGTASAELTIGYDPHRLGFVNARTSPGTSMFSLRESEPAPGTIGLRLTSPRGLPDDSTVIAIMRFVAAAPAFSTTVRFRGARLSGETTSEIRVAELVDGQIVLTTVGDGGQLPASFELEQNYPNPFNPATTLRYRLSVRSKVSLRIFDVLGREIVTLVDEIQGAGSRSVVWDSRNQSGIPVASGVYLCRFEAGGTPGEAASFTRSVKMVLIR